MNSACNHWFPGPLAPSDNWCREVWDWLRTQIAIQIASCSQQITYTSAHVFSLRTLLLQSLVSHVSCLILVIIDFLFAGFLMVQKPPSLKEPATIGAWDLGFIHWGEIWGQCLGCAHWFCERSLLIVIIGVQWKLMAGNWNPQNVIRISVQQIKIQF